MKIKKILLLLITLIIFFRISFAAEDIHKTASWGSTDWPNGIYGNKLINTNISLSQYPQSTVDDWNAGTLLNIDTSTYNASITLDLTKNDLIYLTTSITCRDTYGTQVSTLAVDGDDSTLYRSAGYVSGIPPSDPHTHDEWLKVDMGAAHSSTTVRAVCESWNGGSIPPGSLQNHLIKLQGSNDDTLWTDLVTYQNAYVGYSVKLDSSTFVSNSYRYFRIYSVYTPASSNIALSVFTFSVNGSTNYFYTSQILDYGFTPSVFGNLVSSQTIPTGCDIQYQTRSSADSISWSAWSSSFSNGESIPSTPARYLQWKSSLYSNSPCLNKPQIHEVYVGSSWRSAIKNLTSQNVSFGIINSTYTNNTIEYWTRTGTSESECNSAVFSQQVLGSSVTSTPAQFIQLEIRFNTSTTTVNNPPSLTNASIDYTLLPPVVELNNDSIQNQTYVTNAEIRLEWSVVNPGGNTLTYKLYAGKDPNNMTLVYTGENNYYSLVSLDLGSDYYWQVEAIDIYGFSYRSAVYSFKTINNIAKAYNYPNPFNPAVGENTKIVFDMIEAGNAEIRVYTEFGDLCWHKNFIGLNKGINQIDYNGRDDDGKFLYNGTYICRIKKKYLNEEQNDKCRLLIIK